MRGVREQLGEDAVILSTRRTALGVEITAAIDFDAESIQETADRAVMNAGNALLPSAAANRDAQMAANVAAGRELMRSSAFAEESLFPADDRLAVRPSAPAEAPVSQAGRGQQRAVRGHDPQSYEARSQLRVSASGDEVLARAEAGQRQSAVRVADEMLTQAERRQLRSAGATSDGVHPSVNLISGAISPEYEWAPATPVEGLAAPVGRRATARASAQAEASRLNEDVNSGVSAPAYAKASKRPIEDVNTSAIARAAARAAAQTSAHDSLPTYRDAAHTTNTPAARDRAAVTQFRSDADRAPRAQLRADIDREAVAQLRADVDRAAVTELHAETDRAARAQFRADAERAPRAQRHTDVDADAPRGRTITANTLTPAFGDVLSAQAAQSRPAPPAQRAAQAQPISHATDFDPSLDPDFDSVFPIESETSSAAPAPASTANDMGNELKTLRRMLETQMAQLAWNDLSRRAPIHTEMLRELTEIGLTHEFAAQIIRQLPPRLDITKARRFAFATFSQQVLVTGDRWLNTGGRIALVGATGVGKTTTLAKLAVRWVLRHGPRDLALVSADSARLGAHEQMRALGQLLGAPSYMSDTVEDIPALLEKLQNKRFVLIDTPGTNPKDAQLAPRLAALVEATTRHQIETALVLAASTQAGAIQEAVRRFAPAKPTCAVLTKIDEASSLGGALSILSAAHLAIAYISEGQRIPEDLRPARSLELVSHAVRLARSSGATADEDLLRRRFGSMAHGLA